MGLMCSSWASSGKRAKRHDFKKCKATHANNDGKYSMHNCQGVEVINFFKNW